MAERQTAPIIRIGDEIEVRDAYGRWHRRTAQSVPFLNANYIPWKVAPWMVVSVHAPSLGHTINWPLEDVRLCGSGDEG